MVLAFGNTLVVQCRVLIEGKSLHRNKLYPKKLPTAKGKKANSRFRPAKVDDFECFEWIQPMLGYHLDKIKKARSFQTELR